MCVIAGIIALGAAAYAMPLDTHIKIDRAVNSPTLTIHYTGAHAALVEMKINGESIGTRTMQASVDSGETNFDLPVTDLKDGDNEVEVRLFDRTGKLIASDKTNISTDQAEKGPVYLSSPKVGATVRGPVSISLAFNREIKNSIVSFFVDSNFKAMSNYPPYNYIWDTTRESNGWHEVEAWDVDDASTTFKTRKTRVFVDNPGGPTNRPGVDDGINPSNPTLNVSASGADRPAKPMNVVGKVHGSYGPQSVAPLGYPTPSLNPLHVKPAGGAEGLAPAPSERPIAMGPKSVTPTGHRNASIARAKGSAGEMNIQVHGGLVAMAEPHGFVPTVSTAAGNAKRMVAITRGARVPNSGAFAIELNSEYVNFDVQPRVDDGVPMTPLRYLLEKDGGKVNWENMTKTVTASADGKAIVIQIGDKNARVDKVTVSMEATPYIDRGRTIVPLSFIHDALGVDVEYDKVTGHVLITSADK